MPDDKLEILESLHIDQLNSLIDKYEEFELYSNMRLPREEIYFRGHVKDNPSACLMLTIYEDVVCIWDVRLYAPSVTIEDVISIRNHKVKSNLMRAGMQNPFDTMEMPYK